MQRLSGNERETPSGIRAYDERLFRHVTGFYTK